MEEDTNKVGSFAPKSDEDGSEMKKVSIKFANNPKVLNMCQVSQQQESVSSVRGVALPVKTTQISTTIGQQQPLKNATITSSLLKKLPGNISVSTQRVSVPSQQSIITAAAAAPGTTTNQGSLIPNKPVVVQAINSPIGNPKQTISGPNVSVGPARKIVFNPADSRFLKIVNATPSDSTSSSSSLIPANKKVIVQRVEQIQPPKHVVSSTSTITTKSINITTSGPTGQEKKIIIVPRSNPTPPPPPPPQAIIHSQKPREDSYIVNEMPPEMRNKAIVVSSNNPTGYMNPKPKVIRIPVPKGTMKPDILPNKLTPLSMTKKLLPIRPKIPIIPAPAKEIPKGQFTTATLPGTTFQFIPTGGESPSKIPFLFKPKAMPTTAVVQKIPNPSTSNPPGEFYGDEKKSSFEKLVDKYPEQISQVVAKSVAKMSAVKGVAEQKQQQNTSSNDGTISMGKFNSIFNSINIQIKDGKLSNPHGPIHMLNKDLGNKRKRDGSPENYGTLKGTTTNKSPRLKGRSKSTAVDPPIIQRPLITGPRLMNRSPSLSSILPEFTKQSKQMMKDMQRQKSRTPEQPLVITTENLLSALLCDENMDNVSGSSESSPTKENQVLQKEDDTTTNDKENSSQNNNNGHNNKNNDATNERKDENDKGDISDDEKSTENNSDVEVVGFPDPDFSQTTPPDSPVVHKKRRISPNNIKEETNSDEDIPSVLNVPVHKLFKYQSDRVTDDIYLSDPFRHIKWKDGIGSLEESTIHFKVNQLGVYEVMSNEEYYSLKKHKSDEGLLVPIADRGETRRNKKRKLGAIYKCTVCAGTGMADEFRTPEVCSWTCQDILSSRIKLEPNDDDDSNSTNSPMTDLDETSHQDLPSTPSTSQKIKDIDAPLSLFLNPFPETSRNPFQIGMKLEAIDPSNQSLFCVCTVEEKQGYRIKLRFDGYSAEYNFWVNADSRNIFPPGWCSATDRIVTPPLNYSGSKFDWNVYLKDPKVMAPVQMFPHLKIDEGRSLHFKCGMKLEVDCPIKLGLPGVTCGTITDVIGRRVLIHLDFFDNRYDFWTTIDSPVLHPINYHKENDIKIRTNYEKDFNWMQYLAKTRSTVVPNEAFNARDPIAFQKGMKLEVVDPKNTSLIRPATVKDVNGHRIKVLFDEWPAFYAFWMEDDDPDLHQTHWAKFTKHPLEHPKQKIKIGGCGVIKFCRNIGNALYKSKNGHKVREECPYLLKNWTNAELSDRLDVQKKQQRMSRNIEKVKVPPSPVKSETPQVKRHLKLTNNRTSNGQPSKVKREKVSVDDTSNDKPFETTSIVSQPLKIDEQVKLGSELLKINSTKLPHIETPPSDWNPSQVASYIKSIPACYTLHEVFEAQEINGTALLSLTKEDLMQQLKIKFGPAVKIYNCILKLREKILIELVN